MHKIVFAVLLFAPFASGLDCYSIAASYVGGWKPIKNAPRDGTAVELLETYGVAPTYGLFKWMRDRSYTQNGVLYHSLDTVPSWVDVEDNAKGHVETECLYWRPYKATGKKYVDPTGGVQNTVAYWCAAMHRPYDPKTGYCK